MAKGTENRISHQAPLITILSDHPAQDRDRGVGIGEVEHIADRDLLTLESRLAPVFDILRHRNTRSPLTIAIYGTWGTGKTSAMRWLETRLCEWNAPDNRARGEHPKVHPIWFDPWRYHSREEVWRGIIAEVILALFSVERADRETIGPRLVQAAKKFGAFLGRGFIAALASIKVKVKAKLPGGGEAEVGVDGTAARDIWEAYDKASHPEKAHLNQFEDTLRSWVRDFMPKKDDGTDGERIAVFIDDLDRCLPAVTLEVLEALKLYLNIPSLIFVVGLDREVVDAVVAHEYSKNNIPAEKARSYLDKIFQVDLTIPPSEAQMKGFVIEQLLALDKATSGYWHETLKDTGHQQRIQTALTALAQHNPREVKRVLNSALIRGRTAALDATLDAKLVTSKTERGLRFAQGIQVFLLQRLVRDSVEHSEKLLIGTRHIAWFKTASKLAVAAVQHDDSDIKDGVSLTEKLSAMRKEQKEPTSPRRRIEAALANEPMSLTEILEVLNTLLAATPPTRDDGSAIDAAFWDKPLLWDILLIPFSVDVAQNAPILEAPTPTPEPPDTLLAQCPLAMRERLAATAKVSVISLTLASLTGLTHLDLSGMEINRAGMRLLGRLIQLETLDLSETEVSDVSTLGSLSHLLGLGLVNTKVSDVSALAGLSQLRSLDLMNAVVSDVHALASLSNLQWLRLDDTAVIDVSALSGLSHLRELGLAGTPIRDVSALGSLTQLERLNLSNTAIPREQVEVLNSKLPECQIEYSPRPIA